MLNSDKVTEMRNRMHCARCAKEIKNILCLFKDYIYNYQALEGNQFPDNALDLVIDILSDHTLYTKKGINHFLHSFALSCTAEELSENQKTK